MLQATIYDKLTQLPNRALLLDRLKSLRLKSPEKEEAALVLLDITGFRALNEQLGRAAADNLLLMLAERLKLQTPKGASLARVGADEFALLVPQQNQNQMADILAKINESLKPAFMLNDHELKLRFALGWASSADVPNAEALIEAAGIAMQLSREQKQMVQFQTTMRSSDSRTLALEADLHKALERGQIEVHYQPIIQIADTKVWGFEALMRWRHPRFGLIAPAEFIPLAEAHGVYSNARAFCATAIGATARALAADV